MQDRWEDTLLEETAREGDKESLDRDSDTKDHAKKWFKRHLDNRISRIDWTKQVRRSAEPKMAHGILAW